MDIKYLISEGPSFTRNESKLLNIECDKNTKNVLHCWTKGNEVEDPKRPTLKRTKKTRETSNSFKQQKLQDEEQKIGTEKFEKQPSSKVINENKQREQI